MPGVCLYHKEIDRFPSSSTAPKSEILGLRVQRLNWRNASLNSPRWSNPKKMTFDAILYPKLVSKFVLEKQICLVIFTILDNQRANWRDWTNHKIIDFDQMLICNFLLFFLPNFYAVELLTRHANVRSPAVLKKPCSIRDWDCDDPGRSSHR